MLDLYFGPSHYFRSAPKLIFEILFIMRSTLIVSAFAALALAAPRPQDIDFTGVDSTPDPDVYSAPTNVTSEEVAIQPASAALAIASAAVTDVATTSDPVQEKRDLTDGLSARGGDCAALPAGSGPAVNKYGYSIAQSNVQTHLY
jgi:hypothetical protein